MFTILLFILIISILVLVHEAGHLIVAKWAGVYAEEFSIGMGPKLFTFWHDGETEYTIRALPLGGFVRLQGETESVVTEEASQVNTSPRSFVTKGVWTRAAILSAGIFMNYILGVILIGVVLFAQGEPKSDTVLYVNEIAPNSPAEMGGMLPDDIITAVRDVNDGPVVAIDSAEDFTTFVDDRMGEPLVIQVLRSEETVELTVTPRENPPEGEGAIGFAFQQTALVEYTPIAWYQVPGKAITTSVQLVGLMIDGLGNMFAQLLTKGQLPQDVAGPVGIAKLTGEIAKEGFFQLLQFMALISINLAVVNILPFPALDGGRLAFVVFEGITGKKPLPKWEGWIHTAGLLLLLALMVVITYFDIRRFF